MKLISKFEAISAENGGPKITQQANAVDISMKDNIKNLYLLDKLLKAVGIEYIC